VVSANVDYPTDAGLLAKAVGKLGRLVTRVKAAGGATRTACPDHARAAGRRARQIASKLRLRGAQAKDEAQRVVRQATAALTRLATTSAADAQAVLRNARRALRTATGRRAGQPASSSRPVSSATSAPSRTPPSASSAGVQAEDGRAVMAARSASPIDQPIEYSTIRPRLRPCSTSQPITWWVAAAEWPRTSSRRRCLAGIYANASPNMSRWSAAVFAPALPGRSRIASNSPVLSQVTRIGWNPKVCL
jgi:hypothetical protein